MNYRFHRAALAEHLDQVAFYESRAPGLGAQYLDEFDAVMARVCAAPSRYPQVDESPVRKAGFKRFPLHVIYMLNAAHIIILAIAHSSRRPAYWTGRITR